MTCSKGNMESINVLLKDTIRRREELLKDIENSTNRIVTMSTTPLILLGLYSTALIFLRGKDPNVYIPYILALAFAFNSFYISLTSLKPKHHDKLMPDEIYKRINLSKKQVKIDLLKTYLIIEKDLIIKTNEKPFYLRMMSIWLIGSIGGFLISIVVYVFGSIYFVGVISSIILLIAILLYLKKLKNIYDKKITELKKDLDI